MEITELRKKIMKYGMIVMLIFMIAFGGCEYLYKKFNIEEDNMVEQALEQYIEHETGIIIDFTPNDDP